MLSVVVVGGEVDFVTLRQIILVRGKQLFLIIRLIVVLYRGIARGHWHSGLVVEKWVLKLLFVLLLEKAQATLVAPAQIEGTRVSPYQTTAATSVEGSCMAEFTSCEGGLFFGKLIRTTMLILFRIFSLLDGIEFAAIDDRAIENVINSGNRLFHICKVLRRGLKNCCTLQLLGKSDSFLERNLPFGVTEVRFVPNKNNILGDALRRVVDEVLNLLLKTVKACTISDVIHSHASVRVSIVCVGDRAEAFLPSCVPDLQLDHLLSINLECARLEVDTNRAKIVLAKYVFREPK